MKKRLLAGLAVLGLVISMTPPGVAEAVEIPLSTCTVTASTPVKSSGSVKGSVTVTCTIPPGEPVFDADVAASRLKYSGSSYSGYAYATGSSTSWKLTATASMTCGGTDRTYATNGYGRARKNQRTATVTSSSLTISC
ncbi:MAG: hypothetical protein QM713_11790 [Arachnia sp.]